MISVTKVSKETMHRSNELIATDRKRTNILRKQEQEALAYLVQIMPQWVTSDLLTFTGFLGNVLVFASFVLARYVEPALLLLGVAGFAISWFGDSLDGRLAYYRNKPRKNYGFALDIIVDWLGIILLGFGFTMYIVEPYEMVGFAFVVLYGWQMIMALIRYLVSGKYSIDSGILGPTEVRIIISLILVAEVFLPGSVTVFSILATIILLIVDLIDTKKILRLSDDADRNKSIKQ